MTNSKMNRIGQLAGFSAKQLEQAFASVHKQRYGFDARSRKLVLDKLVVEATISPTLTDLMVRTTDQACGTAHSPVQSEHIGTCEAFFAGALQTVPVYELERMPANAPINGPAIIVEPNSTIVCEPGWQAVRSDDGNLWLTVEEIKTKSTQTSLDKPHPLLLELFNNVFMFVAEQMGITLQNTSYSVNIKERLDFSCAVFDGQGNLIANAPHIPVHLGSMGESVKELIRAVGQTLKPGDVYALNDPYHGGTHLPDITVITPFFDDEQATPLFYVASRGHHADIGGITPGSMPPHSTEIEQEGVLLNMLKVVDGGTFLEADVIESLVRRPKYPVRNVQQNIADLQAQIAANQRGLIELQKVIARFGLSTTQRYMQFVQDNAEAYVRDILLRLPERSQYECVMDCGAVVKVEISIDKLQREATIDFTGTSLQMRNNYNAPESICKAAVMYVFRTLIDADIPLNAGCLRPLKLVIPPHSILSPAAPAAVVAGNVETSQVIVDTLYAALGVAAAAQGTMNNFTFGNGQYQYYETIAGGSGATAKANGASAVQTHMTNSRMTDPEILEMRFPVRVEEFSIRQHSGGAGAMTGGNGVVRKLRFLEPMTASILSNRRKTSPFGIAGGQAGLPGVTRIQRKDGTIETLEYSDSTSVESGDVIIFETPGGGGFGSLR